MAATYAEPAPSEMPQPIGAKVWDSDMYAHGRTNSSDPAVKEFSRGSLRNETNWEGCDDHFVPLKEIQNISNNGQFTEALEKAKLPVHNFWVYDGAIPNIHTHPKVPASADDLLPPLRLSEADFVEFQRAGSKKGWTFHSPMSGEGPYYPHTKPQHEIHGWMSQLTKRRRHKQIDDPNPQIAVTRDFESINRTNNARGIGITGPSSGNGGMAGGYQEVQPERLRVLPAPNPRFNFMGTRLAHTQRDDDSGPGAGAGGFRSGLSSRYPERPQFVERRRPGMGQYAFR